VRPRRSRKGRGTVRGVGVGSDADVAAVEGRVGAGGEEKGRSMIPKSPSIRTGRGRNCASTRSAHRRMPRAAKRIFILSTKLDTSASAPRVATVQKHRPLTLRGRCYADSLSSATITESGWGARPSPGEIIAASGGARPRKGQVRSFSGVGVSPVFCPRWWVEAKASDRVRSQGIGDFLNGSVASAGTMQSGGGAARHESRASDSASPEAVV